jgi:hypothetical protein
MKLWLLPVVLLILAAFACADTNIFNKYVYSAEPVTIESHTFTIYIGSSYKEVIADYGTGVLSIHNNTCAIYDVAKICVDNILIDTAKKEYKAKIRGISLAPEISITRTFSDDEVKIGDKIQVSVLITNNGGYARGIVYNDSFPENMRVVDADEISSAGNSAIWTGNLEAGGTTSFAYSILANGSFEGGFVASLSYMKGSTPKTIYSSSLRLKSILPLEIIAAISSTSAYLGEPENLTINITNVGPATITPTVDISFDQGIEVSSFPYTFAKIGNYTYRWSEEQKKSNLSARNLSSQFVFFFKGIKADPMSITIRSNYEDLYGFKRNLSDIKRDIIIRNKGIKVRSTFADSQLEPNQIKKLKVWVQNLNPYSPITNVYVKTNTSIAYVNDAYFGVIQPSEQITAADTTFYAPDVARDEGYILLTNVTYQTSDGKNYSEQYKDTLTVRPTPDVPIIKSPDVGSIRGGEELLISVSVKNPRITELRKVAIAEQIPGEFIVSGPTEKIVTLRAGETSAIYMFTVKAPKLQTEKEFLINTTLSYSEKDAEEYFISPKTYASAASSKIKVRPEEFTLITTKSITASDVYKGNVVGTKYVVTNPTTDKTARNIVITFPLQMEFDSAGSKEYEISSLSPGESAVVSDAEEIRPKYAGTLVMAQANITYTNEYGYPFSALSSTASMTVMAKDADSPMVVIFKSAPLRVNNTDAFAVNLTLSNIGAKDANVRLSDDGKNWSIALKAGENISRQYTKQIAETGLSKLPQATASYSYGGEAYVTGSNMPEVIVLNKPLLMIEKAAPENVNSLDNFTVQIKVVPLAGKAVKGVLIRDEGYSMFIPELSSEKTYSYQASMRQLGVITLSPATASYNLAGRNFTETSNSPTITVSEIQLLAIKKSLSAEVITSGDDITVTINAANSASEEITAEITDGEKSWDIVIPAGQNKSVSYRLEPTETQALPAAKASYSYAGRALETSSNKAVIQVTSEEKVIKGKASIPLVDTIIGFLKAILTWKRA